MLQEKTLSKPPVSSRTISIRRILWGVLFLNLAVAAAKYIYGTISGSTSMQADGIHSVFDSMGNVVGLVGIAIASRPADQSHPYGHSKFETYASLIIGIFLIMAAFEVGSSAIAKLMSQTFDVRVTPLSFTVMLVTLAINIGVTYFERKQGKKLNSEILLADASHTMSDVLVSIGVVIGLVISSIGFPMADPIMALFVMVAILVTAVKVFKSGLGTLSDRSRIPEDEIYAFVKTIEGVQDAHHIRTRGTEGEVYVDLHVLVSSDMTVREAHSLCELIEEKISTQYPTVREVLVHIEPNDGHVD